MNTFTIGRCIHLVYEDVEFLYQTENLLKQYLALGLCILVSH